jgi:murein L,D-transpeptidase YafK
MSFFRPKSTNYLRWFIIAMGLCMSAVVSTSAIAYVKKAPVTESNTSNHTPTNANTTVIDKVFIDKSERLLQLLSEDKVIKSYRVALGGSPIGHKQQQGDQRTPVGSYTLDYKNEKSKFYRSIHISYPNAADKARAKTLGVSSGGDIMIHGQTNGRGHLAAITQQRDWTEGCIAVTNDEMDEIMERVKLGMPIEIIE